MLDLHGLKALADKLQTLPEEDTSWSMPKLESVPLDSLLKANTQNEQVMGQVKELLHKVTHDDFVMEWAFFQRNELFLDAAYRLFKTQWMEIRGEVEQGDLNGGVLKALDFFALVRPFKDLAFCPDFMGLQWYFGAMLRLFQKHRNDFSKVLRKLIVVRCLEVLDTSMPDMDLLRRSVEYLTRFQGEILENLKNEHLEELRNCPAEEIEELREYHAGVLKAESEPYSQKNLEQLEWCLKKMRAEILLTLLDMGLRNFKEEHGYYPRELGELVPDFLPRRIVDPFGQGDFVYERINSSSYSLCSTAYFGLSELQKSGGHPLMLRVWEDLVVEGDG